MRVLIIENQKLGCIFLLLASKGASYEIKTGISLTSSQPLALSTNKPLARLTYAIYTNPLAAAQKY